MAWMSTRQIPIYDLLAQCYITEDLPGDLQQAQEQVLIIQFQQSWSG